MAALLGRYEIETDDRADLSGWERGYIRAVQNLAERKGAVVMMPWDALRHPDSSLSVGGGLADGSRAGRREPEDGHSWEEFVLR